MLRYIVNQGTKQSERQHMLLLHSKRPRHITSFCSYLSAETVTFQCGTQWSKCREGYVPKAGDCVPKWNAVSVLNYVLLICVRLSFAWQYENWQVSIDPVRLFLAFHLCVLSMDDRDRHVYSKWYETKVDWLNKTAKIKQNSKNPVPPFLRHLHTQNKNKWEGNQIPPRAHRGFK